MSEKASEILVVGSLAYDSIQTPAGKVDRALGGSANYFSLAASLNASVRVVGVVGEDYSQKDKEVLTQRGVDISGMTQVKGKTFHWAGEYMSDLNEAKTLKTELNVFEHFNPELPQHYKNSPFVFLANISPDLQLKVLEQVKNPKFVGCDTMNFWIHSKRDYLLQVLKKVDVLLINETESKMLTGEKSTLSASQKILQMGPRTVVIKRGEYGFVLNSSEGLFIMPAFPVLEVVDPTGAGDSFAGGFFGYLAAQTGEITFEKIKKACVYGCMVASFTIQDFGVQPLVKLQKDDVEKRINQFKKTVSV